MLPENLVRRIMQVPGARSMWRKVPVGSIDRLVRFGVWPRPHYAFGVYSAVQQAKRLGINAISVLELGVAGGRGLLALEKIAQRIESESGVEIAVYGFDGGEGMPAPEDYRDLPYVWERGYYQMDEKALRDRLQRAKLVLGNVGDTVTEFVRRDGLAPVGFIAFDLDYYSSTKQAFGLLEGPAATRLPRMYCYFDDIMWPIAACHNEWIGELRAIREFNEEHEQMKLAPIHMLRYMLPQAAAWQEQMYTLHDFSHPLYCTNLTEQGDRFRQHPL